ncbi:MAG: response regulator, partial [Spirochaetota bacterium]
QKMEAIGTLTSGLAHDFNNILGGIMGSLSLLDLFLKEQPAGRMEKAEDYIKIAVESSKRASEMIHQLLLLSRKQDIKLSPVDINDALAHVMNICANSFSKSISLKAEYSSVPMIVMTDPILIEQIILNFCVNASHAMTIMRKPGDEDGGTLFVSVSSVKIEDADIPPNHENCRPGNYIRIEISDTGIGMDADTQKRIFEPFFTTKNKKEGTGLGLSIAYGFVLQTKGFIEVKSRVNEGSSFRIFLPEIHDPHAYKEDNKEKKNILVKGTGTVLVIDDEQFILDVAKGTLSACGYTVITALNGADGISLYTGSWKDIDAVLLDISMPGIPGLEVMNRLKKINSSVSVLLSSGFSDAPGVAAALKNGAAGFIQKPYTAEDLSRSIHDVLSLRNSAGGL